MNKYQTKKLEQAITQLESKIKDMPSKELLNDLEFYSLTMYRIEHDTQSKLYDRYCTVIREELWRRLAVYDDGINNQLLPAI